LFIKAGAALDLKDDDGDDKAAMAKQAQISTRVFVCNRTGRWRWQGGDGKAGADLNLRFCG